MAGAIGLISDEAARFGPVHAIIGFCRERRSSASSAVRFCLRPSFSTPNAEAPDAEDD